LAFCKSPYDSWRLNLFRNANWEVDCLGRTLGQIILDADRYFRPDQYSLKGKQDIIGRSDFHIICANNTLLKKPGGCFPQPALEPRDIEEIKQKNSTGQQLLHYAAVLGNVRSFKYLLSSSNIEPDCPDALGRAPVFYAASNGHTKILHLLLEQHDVMVDREDNEGYTPLKIAIYNCQLNAIECLLKKGANPNHVIPRSGLTPLALAMYHQDIDVVQLLVSQKDIEVNGESENRPSLKTPLIMAIADRFQEGVQYLLQHERIDVNKRDWNNRTPLYIAVTYGAVDTVRLLATHPKVDVNLASSHGETALIAAARLGAFEITKILLDRKDIKVNLTDSIGHTPLIAAVHLQKTDVILLLLRHLEVDLSLQDKLGHTAIDYVAGRGDSKEIVTILYKEMSRRGIKV
jgi:ankyrin repeat protein